MLFELRMCSLECKFKDMVDGCRVQIRSDGEFLKYRGRSRSDLLALIVLSEGLSIFNEVVFTES